MRPRVKEGKESVRAALARGSEAVLLADLECDAERVAAGLRKSPLYASLSDYAELLPEGWGAEWVNRNGSKWEGAATCCGALKEPDQVPEFFDAAVDMGTQA